MAATHWYLAWVGGIADPAYAINTTGDVWGGSIEAWGTTWSSTYQTTGDIEANNKTISNIVHPEAMIVGLSYFISGPGIPTNDDGTPYVSFTYAGGDSISISDFPLETHAAATIIFYNQAQSTTIQSLLGIEQLVVGRNYAIEGGVLEADTEFTYPGGTTITISAPATRTELNTTLTIRSTEDVFTIKNVADTSGLKIGQTYSIAGPGIPANDFFTYEGGNTLTLTAAATKSDTGVWLAISKGLTEDDGGAFDASVHAVDDEEVLTIDIEQSEGDFATARVEVKNPQIGLLGPSRQFWCWLSWDDGSGTIAPLFHGRLVGVPQRLSDVTVELEFLARPADFFVQKAQLAASLQVAPYWDPVWLANGVGDADSALEAYTSHWHIDRVSLAVTTSDYLNGEDGTIVVDADHHFYDAMQAGYTGAPVVALNVTATVDWTQAGSGEVDLTTTLVNAFKAAGSPFDWPIVGSYTGDGLLSSWPQEGTSIGGGWSMSSHAIAIAADWIPVGTIDLSYSAPASSTTTNTVLPASVLSAPAYGNYFSMNPYADNTIGPESFYSGYNNWTVTLTISPISVDFIVHYDTARKRTEALYFTLNADVQPVLIQPATSEAVTLELTSSLVDQPVDLGGALPIGDIRRNSYFPTDRGQQSLQYLMLLARARLVKASRMVEISFEAPWAQFVNVSCRYTVQLSDPRLPGGIATGKITKYKLHASGQDAPIAEVTIGCAIGTGNALPTANAGDDTYADDYADDYTEIEGGAQVDVITGALQYSSLDGTVVLDDDGLDLLNMVPGTVIAALTIINGPSEQYSNVQSGAEKYGDPVAALNAYPTQVDLQLIPVEGGDFLTQIPVNASPLVIPKMIDLEAPSS